MVRKNTISIETIDTHPTGLILQLSLPKPPAEIINHFMSWSINNILAIALNQSVYFWNGKTDVFKDIPQLTLEGTITCISWCTINPNIIAIATNKNLILWDVHKAQSIHQFELEDIVKVTSWNKNILSLGCSNGRILHYDSKSLKLLSAHFAHPREITNLTWSPDGNQLASVSSNLVKIWELNSNSACCIIRHNEAVSSLSWCPWKVDYLATVCLNGIFRIWNTQTGDISCTMELTPGITTLSWCSHKKEFLTTQNTSEESLILWKFPSLEKLQVHSVEGGVHSCAQNPKNRIIATSSKDTTISLWQIFQQSKNTPVNNTKSNVF